MEEYRRSTGGPEAGVVFHSGDGLPINLEKVGRQVIRLALESVGLLWYGWHTFRRGLASNLYEMGAPDKVVRILRHSRPHVTKERYIKVVQEGSGGEGGILPEHPKKFSVAMVKRKPFVVNEQIVVKPFCQCQWEI